MFSCSYFIFIIIQQQPPTRSSRSPGAQPCTAILLPPRHVEFPLAGLCLNPLCTHEGACCRKNLTPQPPILLPTAHSGWVSQVGTVALKVGGYSAGHLGRNLPCAAARLGNRILQRLRTAPVWECRAFLNSPPSIWLFHISTIAHAEAQELSHAH